MSRKRLDTPEALQETLPAVIVPYATVTGLNLPDDMDLEQWTAAGLYLKVSFFAHKWWLVDWIRRGEEFGIAGRQAIAEIWGISEGSLAGILSAGSRFSQERRRPELTFEHHREVAYLPEPIADELLDHAITETWTCKELRVKVRNAKVKNGIPLGPNPNGPINDALAREAQRGGLRDLPDSSALPAALQGALDEFLAFKEMAEKCDGREAYDETYLAAAKARDALIELIERFEESGIEPL